jgi:hypothetical protein
MGRTRIRILLAMAAGLAVLPGLAAAHGFGSRYELSIPPWLFVTGGAGVVLVSFVVVSVFAGTERGRFTYEARPLRETPFGAVTRPVLVRLARVGAVALLVLGVLAGLFGPQVGTRNLLPNLVWVGWWVGYTFSVILVGNTWPVVNPWKTIYEWGGAVLGWEPTLDWEYSYGSVPTLVLFLGFAWLEVIAPISDSPVWLAAIVLWYSSYLWAGMLLFGKVVWLREADPFTRLFHYLGKFAPLSPENGGELRMYGVGLVPDEESLYRAGALPFLVAVLYTVTFDGFIGTPEWRAIARAAPELPIPYLTSTALMLVGLGLFVTAYVGFAWLIKLAAGEAVDTLTIARRFALSLLPIAIAYQVSHFYTFLLIQGQFLALALVDPFGLGWTLPGLAGFEPTTQLPFLSVSFVWQSQVALIVLGHIVAVWVAHQIALDVFTERWTAVRSQLPMMGLMVGYTMLSLWILTRPVVAPPLP